MLTRLKCQFALAVAVLAIAVAPASAQDRLCDTEFEDCRAILLDYIQARRWASMSRSGTWRTPDIPTDDRDIQAGVPVRVLMERARTRDKPPSTGSPSSRTPASRCERGQRRHPALEDDAVSRAERRRVQRRELQRQRVRRRRSLRQLPTRQSSSPIETIARQHVHARSSTTCGSTRRTTPTTRTSPVR